MEDAPLLAQTPACLGSLLLPAKLFFAGSQKRPPQLKSRPNGIDICSFIINDLHCPITQTLGHYCVYLLNDCGNAERLKAFMGDSIRYCHGFKKWLEWNGKRWVIDNTDQILRLGKSTILEFLRQAVNAKHE